MSIIRLFILLTLVTHSFGGNVKTQYKFQRYLYLDRQLSIYRGAAKGEFITNRDFDKGLYSAQPGSEFYEVKPLAFPEILTYPDVNLDVAPNGEAAMLIGKRFYLLDSKEWKIIGKFSTPRGYSKEQQFVRYYPKQKRALAWVSTVEQEDVYDPTFRAVDQVISVDILAGQFYKLDLTERGGGGFLDLDDGLLVQYPKWAFYNHSFAASSHPLVDFLIRADANNTSWCQIRILPSKSYAFASPSIGENDLNQLHILDWSSGKVVAHKQIFPFPTAKNESWQFMDYAPAGDRILLGSETSEGVFNVYLGLISAKDNNVQARWIKLGTFDNTTASIMGSWDATSTVFAVIQNHKNAFVWHLEDIVPLNK